MNTSFSETDIGTYICKLCCFVYPSSNSNVLNVSTKYMLTSVLSGSVINNFDDNQKICQNCFLNLEKCFNFKTLCLNNTRKSNPILEMDKTCKFCLETKSCDNFRSFNNDVKNMTKKCFKEMDLTGNTGYQSICTNCYELLLILFKFYQLCTNDKDLHLTTDIKQEPTISDEMYISSDIGNIKREETELLQIKDKMRDCQTTLNNEDEHFTINIKEEQIDIDEIHLDSDIINVNKNEMVLLQLKNEEKECFKEKPSKYSCLECPFRSDKLGSFKKHKLSHGLKEHKCDFCDFRSNYKTSVAIHQKRHTVHYPNKCTKCNLGFHYKYKLDLHIIKEHHQDKKNLAKT